MTTSKPNELQSGWWRYRVVDSLLRQGFEIENGLIVPPELTQKENVRTLHQASVFHNRARSRQGLERHESRLLSYIASGTDVIPEKINPRLVLVRSGSEDELLFRYVRLHWSIPVSAGYGRRLRFTVYDEFNGKLMGIFGMCDPIFSLGPRDRWIGWNRETKNRRLQSVMDLFVLGAVPPYSHLLGGKLMALLSTTQYIQETFSDKYGGRVSYISRRPLDGSLALLTTTSALGRSSLYNRLKYKERQVFRSVGFTRGSGEFHFKNGVYDKLRAFALDYCDATAKHPSWGDGFRNRREIVRKTLPLLGLSTELIYHGIEREIFVSPLGANAYAFLRGDDPTLRCFQHTAAEMFDWFRNRWLLPRAARDTRYKDFDPETYRLWETK